MATERESGSGFEADASLRWRRFKGRLFEALLVAATLVGVVALFALFLFIANDAFGPAAAEPTWYLVYFATLVAPISAYTLYVRRRPAASDVNARAFGVTGGALTLSLAVYVVVEALSVYDVAIYFVGAVLPPLAITAYVRRAGKAYWTGPAMPVSVIAGVGLAALAYGPVRPALGVLAAWILYFVVVALPAAAVLGTAAARLWGRRAAAAAAGGTLAVGLAAAGAGLAVGIDPSLYVVLASGVVAPVGFLVAETVRDREAGRAGLLGPAVLVGGVLAGAWIKGSLGLTGPDTWLTPTLLLESWSTFRPEDAGIYPQLVGSVMIVSAMALLSFPVGIGAAIYLEEYAPSTGWRGRLARVLDVNISNLAGVPSVVYGLLGLALFRQVFGLAPGIVLAAAATLGLLILPIVIVSAQEALRSVPDELRQGSYGLGASRWQTVRNVVLPEAVPGILTGTILALGRAIGETAPLVMIGVATTRFSAPGGLFSGATALPLQIFAAKGNNIAAYRTGVVAAAALVLLTLMLLMNATAILLRNRYQNQR